MTTESDTGNQAQKPNVLEPPKVFDEAKLLGAPVRRAAVYAHGQPGGGAALTAESDRGIRAGNPASDPGRDFPDRRT